MSFDLRHPLPGRRALVAGAVRSGVAAARLLARHDAHVRVADRRSALELPAAALALADDGFECAWGRDDAGLLDGRDVLVWTPGLPLDHPLAEAARSRAVPVIGELELGFLAAHAPLVCVTGTNGKSTTTDLIGTLVRAAGREVEVCGLAGRAIGEVAESVSAAGLIVTEVSSFQLETVHRLKPAIGVWLNLTPDHLDRHGTLDVYGAMKRRLFERQEETDWAVWNADDSEVARRMSGLAAGAIVFSARGAVDEGAFLEDGDLVLAWRGGRERLMPRAEVRLPGPHNTANVLAALAATLPLEISPDTLREVLRGYAGLEHRLEPAGDVRGVRFVNDSKATNVASLEVALQSFEQPVVLIAGGRDKGQDFSPLAALVRRAAKHLVLIGEGADAMAKAWAGVPSVRAATMAEAVARAHAAAGAGGVVLLSPACASFDMFTDYEDRGRRFKQEVARLASAGAAGTEGRA